MARATLSHRAFRDNRPARPPSHEYLLERLGSGLSGDSLALTRREMVALTGTLALAASAGVNATASALSATTVTADRRSLRVTVAGRTFRLDAWWFGPSARLNVVRTASAVSISLTSATYPGTDIPADLTLRFTSLDGSTRVKIHSAAFGFSATVPLLAWLEGRAQARSRVSLAGIRSAVGDGYRVRLAGTAQAVLHPDLTLDLSGTRVASLRGPRVALTGDEAHLWLASDATPTALTRRIKLRTFVQIRGRAADWNVEGVATAGGNAVDFGADSFDQATIEAAQTRGGDKVAVVTFENSAESGNASMRFPAGTGAALAASLLPLGNPRYGLVCGDGERFSVIADIADATSWLHRPGHSLLVGRSAEHPRIELSGTGRTAWKTDVQTELLGIAVPIDGVIASPIMFPTGASTEGDAATPAATVSTRTFSPETAPSAAPPGYVADAGSVKITRPDDMLTLKLEFYNLRLLLDPPRLVRKSTGSPSYLVVEFPPQALLEQAYYDSSTGGPLQILWNILQKSPPIKARVAGPTRLAFAIPNALADAGIKYTLEDLLNWIPYDNSVAPAARNYVQRVPLVPWDRRAPVKGTHYPLVPPETILEAPWGLYLSPSEKKEYWQHRLQPFTSSAGVTELWHTTLTGRTYYVKTLGPYRYKPGVRVVWARGYGSQNVPDVKFRNSFTTEDISDVTGLLNRWALVDLTAMYQHARVDAKRLTLSPLGAWLDLKGAWPVTDYWAQGEAIHTGVEAWEHRATMGRDQYVRVVKAGRIFPFGHRAAHVTITERKFENAPDGKRTAYLKQRSFIFMRELEKTYNFGSNADTRQTPFRTVTFKTRVTPDLDLPSIHRATDPTPAPSPNLGTAKSGFWPFVLTTGTEFLFEYVVQDWDGRKSAITSPLIWIAEEYAAKVPLPQPPKDGSPMSPTPPDKATLEKEIEICSRDMADLEIDLEGQKIAYGESMGTVPVDPVTGVPKDRRVLQTEVMRFGAENIVSQAGYASKPYGTQHFQVLLHRAKVRLEDVEALMNSTAGTWIKYWDYYLEHGYGIDNAQGRVFAEIADSGSISSPPSPAGLALNMDPERAGGFATPNLSVRGLSATEGAFGGEPSGFGKGVVDAADFFQNANPKLFGDLRLLDILSMVSGEGVSFSLDDVPSFNDYIVERDGQTYAKYEYLWQTSNFGDKSEIFKPSASTVLKLNTYMEKCLTADIPAMARVDGSLTQFVLSLFGIINVEFSNFSFVVNTDGTVDITPKIEDITFGGALEFVNQLRQLMNFTSDDGGFAIDVTGSGVSAVVTIALPDVSVGIFSLKNMSISAGLEIPFDGKPIRFPFAFCSEEKPFELAVSGFGGGGYFMIVLQAKDENAIARIELQLEFGVCCSISLCGIASGSVEIKGGLKIIYTDSEGLTLTAFFRMAGRLDILGIIAVSVTFLLTLTYKDKLASGGDYATLTGEASLTIDIEILFFSFSVSLTVSKTFEGDDPRFGNWIEPVEWETYCNAFGPATVGA